MKCKAGKEKPFWPADFSSQTCGINYLLICIVYWDWTVNHDTSLPLWVLNKLKSKEKSQAEGYQNFSLFIRHLHKRTLLWRVSFHCVAMVKFCSTSWAESVVHSKKFTSQEQSRHSSRYLESLSTALSGHTQIWPFPQRPLQYGSKNTTVQACPGKNEKGAESPVLRSKWHKSNEYRIRKQTGYRGSWYFLKR